MSQCGVLHCVLVAFVKCMVVQERGILRAGCNKWLGDGEVGSMDLASCRAADSLDT